MSTLPKISYTLTDEAPALATYSFLPILQAFTRSAGIEIDTYDISLAGRILAAFPEFLSESQRLPDNLAKLGQLTLEQTANIIKLPNISASLPQLKKAIDELQSQGYAIPDYPDNIAQHTDSAPHVTHKTKIPQSALHQKEIHKTEIKARYDKIKGSAVNPVLREGNSDRHAPKSVKQYAHQHPHPMEPWSTHSKTHVAHMENGDFYGSERSTLITTAGTVKIVFTSDNSQGTPTESLLKENISVQVGDILDAAVMRAAALQDFIRDQIHDAKQQDILFSVHLKATMMKISDPVIFGYVVSQFYAATFNQHAAALKHIGFNPNNGLGSLTTQLAALPAHQQAEYHTAEIQQSIEATYPQLAMVDPSKGITNLHFPNDVIIDASMPALIRAGGKMLGSDSKPHDTKAVIPDRCYAEVYQVVIDDCKAHGAFDPKTLGSVSNIGLMAQAAEEYGSHDKTFLIPSAGTVRVLDEANHVLLEQTVAAGDIFRMCQTCDAAIQNWIALAIKRAETTQTPAVFWLDQDRAHDAKIIEKVQHYLATHQLMLRSLTDLSAIEDADTSDTSATQRSDTHPRSTPEDTHTHFSPSTHNPNIPPSATPQDPAPTLYLLKPSDATRFSLKRIRQGQDTISVTGNVLRDYLTDLFPIMELGTSAKMLSIVPLMKGGGLFETGAGGSAPKHVQQFLDEDFLRWDSLGEFLALTASLEHLGNTHPHPRAKCLAWTLDQAISTLLDQNKSPKRQIGELDNRGSHFYLALYWAQALATQTEDPILQTQYKVLFEKLSANKTRIVQELTVVQGHPVDIGGYYHPDPQRIEQAMRPSPTLNRILEAWQPPLDTSN